MVCKDTKIGFHILNYYNADNQLLKNLSKNYIKNMIVFTKHLYICSWVSLVRPAPTELPQDGNVARVCGCSGAMQVAYPFFIEYKIVTS